MSQVLFFDYAQDKNALDGLGALITRSGFEGMIPRGGSVAIKLHMGELGNIRYIRPALVRRVVDIVRSRGGRPFLIDTVASYPGARDTKQRYLDTAAQNGFVEASMAAPIVITDDEDSQEVIAIRERIDDCQLREAKVPSLLLQSDCMLVLSHIKGHELTGFGGALKNLGMGCVSTETKRAQHLVNRPQLDEAACDGCGDCVPECPTGAIAMLNGRPERAPIECISCGTCLFNCPSQCWVWPPGCKEKLQVYMAHAAGAVLSRYRGRTGFLNFIQDVVPYCDCAPASGKPIIEDVGLVFSFDPVAADKASLDLIDRAQVIPGSTSAMPPDLMGKIHHTDSLGQLRTAERLRIGTLNYEMVSI